MITRSLRARFKAGPADGLPEGSFTAYASVFGNVDSYGDVVAPGAFADSLKEYEAAGLPIPLYWAHNTTDPEYNLGSATATEDDHGLLVQATIDLENPKGKQAYRLLKGRRINQMSFSYDVLDSGPTTVNGKKVNELRVLKLYEVSLVPVGANQETEILTVKTHPAGTPPAPILATLEAHTALLAATTTPPTTTPRKGVLPMNLMEQHAEALAQAQAIITTAKAVNRDLTQNEAETVKAHLAQAEQLAAHIKAANEAQAAIARFGAVPGDWAEDKDGNIWDGTGNLVSTKASRAQGQYGTPATKGRLALGRLVADAIVTEMTKGTAGMMGHRKSWVQPGSTVVPIPIVNEIQPVATPPLSLLETLPVVRRDSPVYRHIRETMRDNNAAVVAPGEQKPTSLFKVASVDGHLRVIAHLSDPIDQYDLTDVGTLRKFVEAAMVTGVQQALESEILTGSGLGEHMTGLANVSGAQVITGTDLLMNLRNALTALEVIGLSSASFCLNAGDWAALEVQRNTSGAFDLGSPSVAVARQLWSVPVVTTPALPTGTAFLLATDAIELSTDGVISARWFDTDREDYERNQIRARVEGRFSLDILRPLGVVKITTTAD